MNSPTDMMNGPEDDMGMGSVDDPEMMSDPMGNMEMNTPASSEMPSDSDMEDYSAVMDNKSEVEESINEDSDEEKARQRALAKADEPERGEERKKVSLKKAPWEESVNEDDSEQVKVIFRKFPEGDVIALFPEQDQGRGLIGSYMTIGQHSDASKSLITDLEPASKEEYAKLAAELERIGYDIVMAESVNEEIDGKAIDTIRKIADEKSAMKVKFDDGTMMVDMFTASAVKSVYDNVNDANKEKLDNLMKTKDGMMKVANLSMKMLKEGKLNEFVPFLGMLGRAVGGAVGAVSKAGGVANAVSKAGGVANVAKKAIPTARSIGKIAPAYAVGSELVKGVKNAFKDPTYKSATGRHLESIEEKADNIMKSAIDKVNKK
jgi:nucleotide-binding universal stress UspA family protein